MSWMLLRFSFSFLTFRMYLSRLQSILVFNNTNQLFCARTKAVRVWAYHSLFYFMFVFNVWMCSIHILFTFKHLITFRRLHARNFSLHIVCCAYFVYLSHALLCMYEFVWTVSYLVHPSQVYHVFDCMHEYPCVCVFIHVPLCVTLLCVCVSIWMSIGLCESDRVDLSCFVH